MKNFPSNPTTGQTVTFGDVEYTFNGTSWKSVSNPITGLDGKSAYELAVDNGFDGTVEDWLESLQGADVWIGLDQPTDHVKYKLWFDTNSSKLRVYFDDGADIQSYINCMPDGPRADSVPIGGTTGQLLAKATDDDYNTEWVDAPTGGGGGEPYDWTNARRVSTFHSAGGQSTSGMSVNKLGNEAQKNVVTGAYVSNKLDETHGIYLRYTTPATYQMVGTTHSGGLVYSRRRGFKIFEVFGLEDSGNNEKLTAFIGYANRSSGWGSTNEWKTNLPDLSIGIGVGFREGQANWQIVVGSANYNSRLYIDTGVPKPTGTKILYTYSMSCEPGSHFVKITLKDVTNGITICDRFIELYSSQDAGAALIGTQGAYGTIGSDNDYSPQYYYSFFSTGSQVASAISYVHSRTHVETPY